MNIQIQNLKQNKILLDPEPDCICSIMLKAAKIAKKYTGTFNWARKNDKSLLTEADTEIENFFAKFCDHPEQNLYLIGEETVNKKGEDYIRAALREKCWIIDPIDGTAPFACNLPTWGISAAFAENSILKEGAIYLPEIGEIYVSYKGKNLFAENVKPENKKIRLKKLSTEVANFANGAVVSISQDIAKNGKIRISNPVQAVCCTVFSAAGLLRARYAAYVGSMKLWDIAGALPMLLNANFAAKNLYGENITATIDEKVCKISSSHKSSRWRFDKNLIICRNENIYKILRKAFTS